MMRMVRSGPVGGEHGLLHSCKVGGRQPPKVVAMVGRLSMTYQKQCRMPVPAKIAPYARRAVMV
jgi:hypothetical protein